MCDWGYCSHNGPDTWGQIFPLADGSRQSPIDILTNECKSDESLVQSKFQIEYNPRMKSIQNTGSGWKVTASGLGTIQGGPLEGKYRLEQFHCHWGKESNVGSEHTVNGNPYPAEIHLVHWNCDKYPSFSEAVDKEDGLAVFGIFFQLGDEHSELAKLVELLPKIVHNGDNCPVEQLVNPEKFLPENKSYWTYPGSLTTPPCLESVTWIVFKEPVQISEEQLNSFRQLLSYGRLDKQPEDEFEGKILANFRPPLKLGDRSVRTCDC
jgi:carbonic anhydrase